MSLPRQRLVRPAARGRGARVLLLLAGIVAGAATAQPPLLPESVEGPLASRLEVVEPLVWRDPWAAREALDGFDGEVSGASAAERAAYHLMVAESLHYLYDDAAFEAAIEAGLGALEEDSPPLLRLRLAILDGVRVKRSGDFASALIHLEEAGRAAREAGLSGVAVLAAAELAFAMTASGAHEDAVAVLQAAYEDAVALGDRFLIAVVNEVFGVIYTYLDEYEAAVRYYRDALQEYEELDYQAYIAEAIYGLATAHRYAGDGEAALAAFERYRDLTVGRDDRLSRFMALYGLGSTYSEMGDCRQALAVIREALGATGPEDYKAELLKRAAVCYAEAGEEGRARAALADAQAIITGMEDLRGTRWEIDLLLAEARMESALGEHAAAYTAMVAYHAAWDSLQQKNMSERRATRREAMENERQALRIELLQEQARVRQLEFDQQRREMGQERLVAGLLVGGLVLVAAIVLWRLRDLRRWRELSTRDSLTGVANRRQAFSRLESLLAELDLARGELAIILLDVDDFKRINDRLGHPTGDRVLVAIAGAVATALRPGDELSRVGGEEFLVVLPRTGLAGARTVAERIRADIRELALENTGAESLRVTVSIGIATVAPGRESAETLYAAADAALYQAKATGKNRFAAA